MGGRAASGWRGMRHVRPVGAFAGRGVDRGNWCVVVNVFRVSCETPIPLCVPCATMRI